jgi:predicted AAA+ superfamily ATPase
MYRFWAMLAHGHGQIWNASEIGRSMGLADTTVRSYLDKMADAFVMRQLQPWHENLGKRQVKAPKTYVRDSGLLHTLLDVHTMRQLELHPESRCIVGRLRHRPGDSGAGWIVQPLRS